MTVLPTLDLVPKLRLGTQLREAPLHRTEEAKLPSPARSQAELGNEVALCANNG
jgi:hypothetical protein